jgi:hypothetical protein
MMNLYFFVLLLFYFYVHMLIVGDGAMQFGVANQCGLDCLGIESQWEQDFLCLFRLALRPTQPPLQWVHSLFCGVKLSGCGVDHSSLSSAAILNGLELYLRFPPVPI